MARHKSELIRNEALAVFKTLGGIIRTSEALQAGIHPRVLYELRDMGQIEQLERGLFGLTNLPEVEYPDLVIVSKKVPGGVICLISALYFHRLTVQIPRWVDVAVPQKYRPPVITYPPVHFHWYSERVLETGVELHDFNGAPVLIYSPEKTIVDCFRLRRKIGIDVAIEALKTYWHERQINLDLLWKLAKVSRMQRIMKPYLESVMHDQS